MADHEINEVNFAEPPAQQPVEQADQVNEVNLVEPPAQQVETETQPSVYPPLPASPVSDEEEEEEEEDSIPPLPVYPVAEEEEHVGPHLQPHHEVAWQYTQQIGLQTFLFLQVVWNFISYVASTTQTISKGVLRSVQKQLYVFFEHSNHPYRAQEIHLTGAGVAPVEWYYDADKSLFISSALYTTTTDYETNHLEWLCGQIKYNNLVLYDISEFLQQIRWAGRVKPSVSRVLAVWSLHSGIILNAGEGLTLQTINEDGTESTLVLRGQGA
jgi:hypothetical protein